MNDTQVLVVGAGPIGLMLAAELRRHRIACRIVEQRTEPSTFCKAIGLQPRSLELFEMLGILEEAVARGIWIKGQEVYVNGRRVADMRLPSGGPESLMGLPYGFLGLPQYETEAILTEHVAELGVAVERGWTLQSLEQAPGGVSAHLSGPSGSSRVVTADYLVGCDGAHSQVRKQLGISFEGDRLADEFMLADAELDGPMEHGMPYRFLKRDGDRVEDMLVCIPLPGGRRFRLSTLYKAGPGEEPADLGVHYAFVDHRPTPTLEDFQHVLDDLALPGTRITRLRWSSVFGISHRLAGRYRVGRAFIAGDAAHIHAPSGAQGMNTGLQDSMNLAWKLAAVIRHGAPDALLDSYEEERRPIGSEVVARARAYEASQHVGDRGGLAELRSIAQIDVSYRGGSLSREQALGEACPVRAGDRLPEIGGLVRQGFGRPLRLRDLADEPRHLLLVWAADDAGLAGLRVALDGLRSGYRGRLLAYLVHPQGSVPPVDHTLEIEDRSGRLAEGLAAEPGTTILVRPDGHLGYRAASFDAGDVAAWLAGAAGPPATCDS